MPKSKRRALVHFCPRNGFRDVSTPSSLYGCKVAKSNDVINGIMTSITSGKKLGDVFEDYYNKETEKKLQQLNSKDNAN